MKYSDLKCTLKEHSLRITDCRMDVLQMFLSANYALSLKNLEVSLRDYDRVTLYRTLNSFIKKGILHRIPNDSGAASYGICHDTCNAQRHKHDHVHFQCNECGHIQCLPSHQVPKVKIPGYQINEANLIVTGLCAACNN